MTVTDRVLSTIRQFDYGCSLQCILRNTDIPEHEVVATIKALLKSGKLKERLTNVNKIKIYEET